MQNKYFYRGNNSGKSRLIRGISNNILDIFNKFLSIKDVLKHGNINSCFSTLYQRYQDHQYLLSSINFKFLETNDASKIMDSLIFFNDNKGRTPKTVGNPDQLVRAQNAIIDFIKELPEGTSYIKKIEKNVLSFYIPVLRGLKPLEKNNDVYVYSDIYSNRILNDYGKKISVYTGLEIFEDIKSKLLGTEIERKVVTEFEQFLEDKIFKQNVTLIPKYKEDILHIKIGDEEQRSIAYLGDGLQALIVILYPIFKHKMELAFFFIEEPETHLHPTYQKLLLQLLSEISDLHQYFITTHSNNFLDSSYSSIFSITKENGLSKIKHLVDDNHKWETLSELGYKASDLLQTNFIIWVEGPSDKIYLNYLLEKESGVIKENIHYTIMFYAGTTGTHLVNEEEEIELITSINRNCAWICDSDKEHRVAPSKNIKIKSILENKGVFFWETTYRELENHIDKDVFINIVKRISGKPDLQYLSSNHMYGDRFKFSEPSKNTKTFERFIMSASLKAMITKIKNIVASINAKLLKAELQDCINNSIKTNNFTMNNKVKIAKEITKIGFEPDTHLKKMIKTLVQKINSFNDLPV
ncbi:MAG: AAA family ATPase [Saprospiraceae bacterium]|nr:AAA family ATPase [Saprospiraceae bacterium]